MYFLLCSCRTKNHKSGGVEKVVEFALNSEEQALLDNSVNAVKNLVADMERLGF
ncbi:MAG: hypothetical protein BWY38_00001 [Ignavibacteria bacterium ADurb.Bin266]|jgi:malate dehydrogenase|nr:MAG: hypothetical protein BWY38_00001 [Ignavibacteria bacterium ADurb.Bin266]